MKRLLTCCAVLAAVAMIAGSGKTSSAGETEKLICAFTFWPGQGIYILAEELDYMDEEGVEMEFIREDDIQVQTEAMESGHINCNARTIGEYQSRPRTSATDGVVIAMMDFSRGGDGVIAAPHITNVCDMEGKTFAMEPTLPANLLLQIELKDKCGLTLNDLNIVHIATADGMAVFADEEIDAIESYEPLLSQILAANDRPGAYMLVDSNDHPELIVDVIFLSKELLAENPELVHAFIRAIYRAADYYFANPDHSHELMAPEFNLTKEEMAEAFEGLTFTTYEEAIELFGTNENPGRFKEIFDTVMQLNIEQGVADEVLVYENQVDASYINAAFDN